MLIAGLSHIIRIGSGRTFNNPGVIHKPLSTDRVYIPSKLLLLQANCV